MIIHYNNNSCHNHDDDVYFQDSQPLPARSLNTRVFQLRDGVLHGDPSSLRQPGRDPSRDQRRSAEGYERHPRSDGTLRRM